MSVDGINLTDAGEVCGLLHRAAEALRQSPLRRGCSVMLPAAGRLLVTGDLHDNPLHLRTILRLARLTDDAENHIALHEIIHGERLINGMDFSYRMLLRIAALVVEHPRQVHPLLANHELSQMRGRAVSKGAGDSVQQFNDALAYAFGNAWEPVADAVADFIRAMPLALRSEAGVLCAHSLPAAALMGRFDLDVLDREMTDEDFASPHGSAYMMVWGRQRSAEQIEQLARHWNVRLFCLGHQHVEDGIDAEGERVLILNSDHDRGVVLPIDLGNVPTAPDAMLAAVSLRAVAHPEELSG